MPELPDFDDGLPPFCGAEAMVARTIADHADTPVTLNESPIDFGRVRSACAAACASWAWRRRR